MTGIVVCRGREWFAEAESVAIRSAVKFYFDIDVQIFFQLLQKIFFRSIQKKKFENFRKKWKFSIFRFFPRDFQKKSKFSKKIATFFLWRFSIFWKFWKFSLFRKFSIFFCWSIGKNIFWKSWKKSGHQYRSKISLRIEWEHSQRLKTTPKYSWLVLTEKPPSQRWAPVRGIPPMMTIFPPFEPSPVNLDATTVFPLEMAMVPQWWFGYKSRGASMYSRFCVSKIRGPLTIYNHLIHRRVCIYYQSARSPCFCFAVNLLH